MLHEQIKSGIKEAMMAKDSVLLETLRGMSAAFTNELVAKGRKPNEMLEDADVLAVITRLAKQRKDSIDQFRKGGREELAQKEEAEIKVIEEYLPAAASDDDIRRAVEEAIQETGAASIKDMGKVMKATMSRLAASASSKWPRSIVTEARL